MDDPSRTRTPPLSGPVEPSPDTLTRSASGEPVCAASPRSRTCCVCGRPFVARRPEARACSGKCRMSASRGRRVADLVARIEAAEAQLRTSEDGLRVAREALAGLRELATLGSSKVMP